MDPKKIASLASKLAKALKQLEVQQAEIDAIRAQIQQEVGGSAATSKTRKGKAAKKGGRAAKGAVGAAILEVAKKQESFKVEDVLKHISSSGASVNKGSINAAIGKMVKKDKTLKKVSRGVYAKA